MSAPQKLGLDVVVDKHTGDLVTLEVNGFFSGYNGLKVLGRNLAFDIVDCVGKRYYGKKILINPKMHELYGSEENLVHFETLKEDFMMDLIFSPFIQKKTTQKEIEILCGSLDQYSALLGFGDYLEEVACPQKMINSPAVELLTKNKFIQYELLKDIPNLNMPKTVLVDKIINQHQYIDLRKKYGKIIEKPINGTQGRGITILENNLSKQEEDFLKNGFTEIFYLPVKPSSVPLDPKETYKEMINRMETNGVLLQKFISTEPIVYRKTEEAHYAKARLIWFGKYLGGYWALSNQPIDNLENRNLIVNYCNSGKSQLFSHKEEKIFEDYTNKIVPKILENIEPFQNKPEEYKKITLDHYMEAIFRNPKRF